MVCLCSDLVESVHVELGDDVVGTGLHTNGFGSLVADRYGWK
jgi:hypothetical protein